jgi:large subunit ribosomal protein L25
MEARLESVQRDSFGKNEAHRIRVQGRVPAVLYGGVTGTATPPSISIAVDPKTLLRILHSESGVNTLIGLKVGDDDVKVLVREYQIDPVTNQLLHVDFYRVAMDKKIIVTVPVVLKGEPRGVKLQGGLLDFVHREIQIECLPGDIPEHIEVEVSELMLGQAIRLRDVATDPRWTPVSEPEIMLAHVVALKVEAEPTPAEGVVAPAAAAEPEVIKKGKTEKAEAED